MGKRNLIIVFSLITTGCILSLAGMILYELMQHVVNRHMEDYVPMILVLVACIIGLWTSIYSLNTAVSQKTVRMSNNKIPWLLIIAPLVVGIAAGLTYKNPVYKVDHRMVSGVLFDSLVRKNDGIEVEYPDFDFKSAFIALLATVACLKVYELVEKKLLSK